MKNIFKSLLIVLVTVSFMSCSSDDDSSNNSTNDTSAGLVGTWNLVGINYNGDITTEVAGQLFSVDLDGVGENLDFSLTFSDPDEFMGSGSFDIILTTTVSGGQTTTGPISVDIPSTEGTWEQNGTMLTTDEDLLALGAVAPVDNEIAQPPLVIEELTDTTLILTQEVNQERTIDGIIETTSIITEVTFTRQ